MVHVELKANEEDDRGVEIDILDRNESDGGLAIRRPLSRSHRRTSDTVAEINILSIADACYSLDPMKAQSDDGNAYG